MNTCQVAPSVPVDGLFDYLIPEEFAALVRPGIAVKIPFGRRKIEGIVYSVAQSEGMDSEANSTFKLKPIDSVLSQEPLFNDSGPIGPEQIAFSTCQIH